MTFTLLLTKPLRIKPLGHRIPSSGHKSLLSFSQLFSPSSTQLFYAPIPAGERPRIGWTVGKTTLLIIFLAFLMFFIQCSLCLLLLVCCRLRLLQTRYNFRVVLLQIPLQFSRPSIFL